MNKKHYYLSFQVLDDVSETMRINSNLMRVMEGSAAKHTSFIVWISLRSSFQPYGRLPNGGEEIITEVTHNISLLNKL